MSAKAIERWKEGYGKFLADPVKVYEEKIRKCEENIILYEDLAKRQKVKIIRLKALKEVAEQGLMTTPDLDCAYQNYRAAISG